MKLALPQGILAHGAKKKIHGKLAIYCFAVKLVGQLVRVWWPVNECIDTLTTSLIHSVSSVKDGGTVLPYVYGKSNRCLMIIPR